MIMKTKKELESKLNEVQVKLRLLKEEIRVAGKRIALLTDKLMRCGFKPDHLGKFFRVDKGGNGCGIANGISGMSVTKPSWRPKAYAGEVWGRNARVYIRGVDGVIYGLCEGYEIEEISKDKFIHDLVKEHLYKDVL